jgi:hypothetical protein
MNIRIPRLVVRAWDIVGDWSNVPIYKRGKHEIRRIDVALFVMGILIAVYYYTVYGWQMAAIGVLMYVMVMMMALWLL